MTEAERRMIRTFITMRQEIAFNRLNENSRFMEVCQRQKESEDKVEELLHKLEKDERISIRRHYEGETEKTFFELNEVYMQGLRDSVKFLLFLGVFSSDVSL